MTADTAGVLAVNFLTEDVDPKGIQAAAESIRVVDFF
jgi:hypothetical protein